MGFRGRKREENLRWSKFNARRRKGDKIFKNCFFIRVCIDLHVEALY